MKKFSAKGLGVGVGTRILIGYLVAVLVFGASVYYTWVNLENMQRSEAEKAMHYRAMVQLQQVISLMNQKYIVAGDLMINEKEEVLLLVDGLKSELAEITNGLEHLSMTEKEQDLVSEILRYNRSFDDTMENELIPAWRQGNKFMAQTVLFGASLNTLKNRVNVLAEQLMTSLEEDISRAEAENARMVKQTIFGLLVSLAISVLVVVLMAMMLMRSISRPLRRLTLLAQEMSQGKLAAVDNLEVKSTDEIGQLARAFKEMGGNLKELLKEMADVSRRLMESSGLLAATGQDLGSATQQVAASAEELSAGTESQLEKVTVSETAVAEITAEVDKVAADVKDAVNVAGQASEAAGQGRSSVDAISRQMYDIYDAVKATSSRVQELNRHSEEIGKIVSTISDIAEQTNLLALNAAIEAARAGEQGRGFAVVADEVRKLAEEAATATRDIAGLITNIQGGTAGVIEVMQQSLDKVKQGGTVVDQAGSQFEGINEVIQHLVTAVKGVGQGAQRVAGEIGSINTAMQEIAQGSQQAAGASQEVAASMEQQSRNVTGLVNTAENLAGLAEELSVKIKKFDIGA